MTSQTHFKTLSTRSSLAGKEGTLYIEPTPRFYQLYSNEDANRVPLMQSKAAFLIWEGTSSSLALAFHKKDVVFASNDGKGAGLVPSNHKGKSNLASQDYDLITEEKRSIEGVAWIFAAHLPIEGPLKGRLSSSDMICLDAGKFPAALEESEPILDHVKNPYHRVDATDQGEEVLVADTDKGNAMKSQAMTIFETSLPTRWYLPADCLLVNDNGPSTLVPSPACKLEDYPKDGLVTRCPYKGVARYHKLILPNNGGVIDNAIWAYPEAIPALDLRGLTCFWTPGNDRLKLVVDGEHVANER